MLEGASGGYLIQFPPQRTIASTRLDGPRFCPSDLGHLQGCCCCHLPRHQFQTCTNFLRKIFLLMPSLDVPSCNLWLWLIRVCLTSPQLLDLSLFYCSLYMVTGPLFTCASLSLLASPHGHVSQHPSILATICWALPAVPMSPLTCKHKLTQRWRLLSTKIFPSAAGHSSWCSPIYGLY